jgi:hypothetical protein
VAKAYREDPQDRPSNKELMMNSIIEFKDACAAGMSSVYSGLLGDFNSTFLRIDPQPGTLSPHQGGADGGIEVC